MANFTPWLLYSRGKISHSQWIGCFVRPSVRLDAVEKKKYFAYAGNRTPLLYRLSHPIEYLIFWDTTSCNPLKIDRRFAEICRSIFRINE
jgi:hypothetical protein